MKEAVFKPGISFESNTIYRADRKLYDITLADTVNSAGHGYAARYKELATAFLLKDIENVTIDLDGATLMFHGRIAPFILSHCTNVTLKNFVINYDRPFYSQAEILEASTEHLLLRPDPNFPCGMVDGVFSAIAPHWVRPLNILHFLAQPFDPITRAPAHNAECMLMVFGENTHANLPLPLSHLTQEILPDGNWLWHGKFHSTWRPGMILVFTHEIRDKNSILAEYSSNITVENVRLLHGAAMGFVGMFSHDIKLRRFDMYLDGQSKGLVTVNADSVHCFHCTGHVLIEDCIFENMLDDAINIHGNYNKVAAVDNDTLEIEVIAAGLENIRWYAPGDRISIQRGGTIEKRGEYTIKQVEYPSARKIKAKLTQSAPEITAGDIVESMAMPEITVRRCISGNNRPRGFLLSSGAKTLVEDCYFRTCSNAIHFTGDTTYWYESGPVHDVTIRRCHFHNCGYCGANHPILATPEVKTTEKEPCYHSNITIEDNVFESFTPGMLFARQCRNIVFRRNRFIATSDYSPREGVLPIDLEECFDCTIEN